MAFTGEKYFLHHNHSYNSATAGANLANQREYWTLICYLTIILTIRINYVYLCDKFPPFWNCSSKAAGLKLTANSQ